MVRSSIRGPAIIGAGALIEDAYIGPYTAISTDVRRAPRRGRAQHPAGGRRVEDLDARVESSLIGRGVTIARTDGKPRAYRFMVGDSSSIGLV